MRHHNATIGTIRLAPGPAIAVVHGRLVHVPATPLSAEFTPARAVQVAKDAAGVVGLAHEQAGLIRLGTNAIVRLQGGVIARVARDESWTRTSERELRVAAELLQAAVPCVQPWPVRQPVIVSGHPVTFWTEIPGPLDQPLFSELGRVLRQIHNINVDLELPVLDPWEHIPQRIEQAPINESARHILRNVLHEVQDRWATARFELTPGVIHGDAHIGNVVRSVHGSVVLTDLDSTCRGPREWDLAPTGLYASSLGWITRREYTSFVAAYGGFDVTKTLAFPLLSRTRELRMTAWIAMHAGESETLDAEVTHRVACLADPELPRHWSAR